MRPLEYNEGLNWREKNLCGTEQQVGWGLFLTGEATGAKMEINTMSVATHPPRAVYAGALPAGVSEAREQSI